MKKVKEKSLDIDDVQQEGFKKTIEMINDKGSILHYDPTHTRRAVENGEVIIFIQDKKISVVNGVHHYDIPISERINDSIVNKFNSKLTRKFNAKENQVNSKIKDSIKNIEIKK